MKHHTPMDKPVRSLWAPAVHKTGFFSERFGSLWDNKQSSPDHGRTAIQRFGLKGDRHATARST